MQRLAQECRAATERLKAGDASAAIAFLQGQLAKFRAQAEKHADDPNKYARSMEIISKYEAVLKELGIND